MGTPNDRGVEWHKVDVASDGQSITVDGLRVHVLSGPNSVRVGCHTVTKAAWERLKLLIDGKNGGKG